MSFYCTYFTRWLLIKDFLNANKTYTYISIQNLSNLYTNHFPNKVNNENGNKPITKKKKIFSPKISLYIDDKLTVTTLQEAEKLANRRDFKLMQLDKACSSSSSSGRLVYKLLSKSQLAASGKKPGKAHKGEKELALTAKIGRHDIDSKIKNISKWLSKNLEVKVVVSGEPDLAVSASSVSIYLLRPIIYNTSPLLRSFFFFLSL